MIVLGIETSCDETAAAVVDNATQVPCTRSNLVRSQLSEHSAFGGVVPEIAARAHLDHLEPLLRRALDDAGTPLVEIDAVAAAAGPGLIGGLIVGTMMAKGIAWAAGKPFIAINHLEAHALSVRLTAPVNFPYLLLLVSGGHCQLLACLGVGRFTRLGTTLDDAAGEAFDKTAKLIGLDYPGGPAIERAAKRGDTRRFVLPRPLLGRPGCDFCFPGSKPRCGELPWNTPRSVSRTRPISRLPSKRQSATHCAIVPPMRLPGFAAIARKEQPWLPLAASRRMPVCGSASPILRKLLGSIFGTAAGTLYRQRGDGGLGRDRATSARARRRSCRSTSPALAA